MWLVERTLERKVRPAYGGAKVFVAQRTGVAKSRPTPLAPSSSGATLVPCTLYRMMAQPNEHRLALFTGAVM